MHGVCAPEVEPDGKPVALRLALVDAVEDEITKSDAALSLRLGR